MLSTARRKLQFALALVAIAFSSVSQSWVFQEVDYPGAPETGFANNDGDIETFVGFIYDPASNTFTDITFPDGFFVFAQGINANGEIVGSVNFSSAGSAYPGSPPGRYGYLREPDGSTTLFRVNGLRTAARGINDAGLITGFVNENGGSKGFVATLPGRSGYQAVTIAATQVF